MSPTSVEALRIIGARTCRSKQRSERSTWRKAKMVNGQADGVDRSHAVSRLALNSHYNSIDIPTRCPAVDPPTVVADLKPISRNRFHQVQVLASIYLAKNDASDCDLTSSEWGDGYELATLDFSTHAVTTWTELYCLATRQLLNVFRRPRHTFTSAPARSARRSPGSIPAAVR